MVNKSQFFIYVIGIVILALGITFMILAGLGTLPFDALLVGLANNVGLTVGSWEIIIAFLMIGSNALLSRKRPEILGLVTAFITGASIDLWLFLLRDLIVPELILSQFVCLGIGIFLTAFGTAIYLHTNFAPIPIDRLNLILKEIMKTNLFISRTLINLLFLILAIILSGPIGVGTVLTVCFNGLLLNYFMPIIGTRIDSMLGRQERLRENENHIG